MESSLTGRSPAKSLCALHIHTVYSDGTQGVERIVADARAAGIDVLLITDHHTMAAAHQWWGGWHDDVLVIVGYEHSDPQDENHLLVFGLDTTLDPALQASRYVRDAVEMGARVFLAHPVERRARRGRIRPYPWTAGVDLPFQGIEVWNFMSLWVERFSPRSALLSYFFPGRAGERPDPESLHLWDRCAAHRPVAGIAGLDAHALKVKWGLFTLTLFSHARHFQGPLTVVETPRALSRSDAAADTELILTHLAQGASMMGISRRGPLREIVTFVDGSPRSLWGQLLTTAHPVRVGLALPVRARVRLVSEGRSVAERNGREVSFTVDAPGVYRIEIRRGGALWALTNHFRVMRPTMLGSVQGSGGRGRADPRLRPVEDQ